jgi:hypothetical protein
MKFSLWLENRGGLYNYKGKTIKTWGKILLKKAIKHMGDFREESKDKLMRDLDVLMRELPRHPKQMGKDKISKDEFSIIVMDYLGNHDRFNDPVQNLLKVM